MLRAVIVISAIILSLQRPSYRFSIFFPYTTLKYGLNSLECFNAKKNPKCLI